MSSIKKIILLGGTGAIGKYLTASCKDYKYEVHVTTRSDRSEDGVVFHRGDAKDIGWVESLLREGEYDAVVDFMVYRTHEFKSRFTTLLSLTQHYVFLSSYRVYASSKDALSEDASRLLDSTDDKEFLRTDEYSLAKARQEDCLQSVSAKNWTIVRPSITYSQGRFQFGCLEANTLLTRAAEGLPVVIPEEMLQVSTTMTWAGDVGEMIAKLLFNPNALGSVFNVCSSESVTWSEVGKIYSENIGLKIAQVDMDSYLSLGINPYQVKYDRMCYRRCSNEKILEVTGIDKKSLMSVKAGLSMELKKSNHQKNLSSMTRIHGRMDRILGIGRVFKVSNLKECLQYLSGYIKTINDFTIRYRMAKTIPLFKS